MWRKYFSSLNYYFKKHKVQQHISFPQVDALLFSEALYCDKKNKDKKKKKGKKCCKSYKKKEGKMCKDCPKMQLLKTQNQS